MRTLVALLTAAVVAVASVIAWRGHSTARDAEQALVALKAQRAQLDADIARIEKRRATAQRAEAESDAIDRQSPTPDSPDAARPVQKPSPSERAAQPSTANSLEAHPGLRALFRKSVQANLTARYRAFYKTARLSSEKIQQFEQLMTEAEETKMDFQVAAHAEGLDPSDPALKKLRADGATALETAQRALLGDADYEHLQQHHRMQPLQVLVAELAKLSARTPTPLGVAQSEQLLTVTAHASSGYRSGTRADLATVDWTQALSAAQGFLTPTQYAAFRDQAKLQQVYRLVEKFYAGQRSVAATP